MNQFFDRQEDAPLSPPMQGSAPEPMRLRMPYHPPKVTCFLIGLTTLVYVAQLLTPMGNGIDLLELYGARINPYIRAGQIWRFITPVFLHASIPHIFFNMYALLVIGAMLEKYYGHLRFAVLYFLGGFAGNVFSFLLGKENGFSVGASTAVFGLITAEVIFFYQNRQVLGSYAKQAMTNTLVVIVLNLAISLSPGIDGWGHVGGLLGGGIFAWFASPIWQVTGIPPMMRLEDKREYRDWAIGIAAVVLIFGFLALWGFFRSV